jgi:hypothetical protein
MLLVALSLPAFAQCTVGSQSPAAPQQNCAVTMYYSGTDLIYICSANAIQPTATFYKSSTTLTSIVVATNVGTITFSSTSYLWIGALVTVAGSTTSALNATYKVTAVSGSTATITTSGVSDGTYNNAALTVSTQSPLLNSLVWAIQALTYDGSHNLTGIYWAGPISASIPHNLACSNRANY